MLQDDDIALLRAENHTLRTDLAHAHAQLVQVSDQLAAALARIAELEQQRHDPPPFVKPNCPNAHAPKRPRKKRTPEHNHGRRREPPTRIEPYALDRCSECHYRLHGHRRDYTRQVIDLPLPQPVEVVEHQVIKRWCA